MAGEIAQHRDQPSPHQRLASLFDDQHQRLFRLTLRMGLDAEEARDAVQEAFLRAARRVESLPSRRPQAEAWLVRAVVNLSHDRHRRLRVERRHADPVPPHDFAPRVEAELVARTLVRTALTELPARRRAVVVLRYLDGLEVREVASWLGMSRVTVRWHLSRARRELAAALEVLTTVRETPHD